MFCELNFMNEFIYLASSSYNRDINLQIIKSFAALILTITNKNCLYYIFSNNFINQIISNNFEKYDEDFLSYYVNFLKSLTLKIDITTIQFFFFKDRNSFPLLENSLKLYNHTDSMIKNVVRNIYLTFCKLKHEPLYKYLCTLPSITYFTFIACRLRDLSIDLDKAAFDYQDASKFNYQDFKSMHDDLVDEILYLQDIFSLNLPKISLVLTNCLMYYYILPLLFDSLILQRDLGSYNKVLISPQLSMYLIALMIKSIKNEPFINVLINLLFNKKIYREILKSFIFAKSQSPSNYYFEWKDQKKNLKIPYNLYITYNFSPQFIVSLITMSNSSYKEVRELVKEYEQVFNDVPNFDPNAKENSINIIKNVVQTTDYDNMKKYHTEISKATGLNLGLYTAQVESLLNIYKKGEKDDNKDNFIDNPIRNNLIDVFLHNTDEICILMVNVLIDIILHKENNSDEVLAMCGLLQYEKWNEISINNTIKSFKPDKDLLSIFDAVSIETSPPKINETTDGKNNISKSDTNNTSSTDNNDQIPKKEQAEDMQKSIIDFDNHYYKEKFPIQSISFDSNLVDILLSLLLIEKPFCSLETLVIVSNITELFLPSKENEQITTFTNIQIESLNKIYYTYLSKIVLTIECNLIIFETSYEGFENMWKSYKEDTHTKIEKLSLTPFLFLNQNLCQNIDEYPFKALNSNNKEMFNHNLIAFMCLHDCCVKLNNATNLNKQSKISLIKDKFPLSNANYIYDINQIFSLEEAKSNFFKCEAKKSNISKYTSYIIVVYLNYVFFGTLSPEDENKIVVKMKFPLRLIEIYNDRKEPKCMNFNVTDKGKYIEINIMFDNEENKLKAKSVLETSRKSARDWEKQQIKKYFNEMIKMDNNNNKTE